VLSWRPARIAGLAAQGNAIEAGRPANLAIVDPAARWVVDADRLASKARNTPFAGRTLTGKVRHTIYAGELVVDDGEVTR
jgi:dihydroorotase